MVLFLDTHLSDVVAIIYNEGKIEKYEKINSKHQSEVIMPLLASVLDDYTPESIIIVNGPGFFTSVRLGVTIAKTLAYTMNIPIRTITSLECLAISSNISDNKTVAISDNNGYYIGEFNIDNKLIDSYQYLSKSDFDAYSISNKVLLNVEEDYKKIIEYALNKKEVNPHEVNPIYIKKLDVEK